MIRKESGPGAVDARAEKQTTGRGAAGVSTLPPATDEDWQRAAERVNGLFVAVVAVTDDKVRRRCFVTLAAAQRHADRARERGQECPVVLAETAPRVRAACGGRVTPGDQVDARIRELVRDFPATPRRHVQDIDGDWLPCYRGYRRVPKGDEVLVYIPVSEATGEWTIVALCSECWRAER